MKATKVHMHAQCCSVSSKPHDFYLPVAIMNARCKLPQSYQLMMNHGYSNIASPGMLLSWTFWKWNCCWCERMVVIICTKIWQLSSQNNMCMYVH